MISRGKVLIEERAITALRGLLMHAEQIAVKVARIVSIISIVD